MHLDGFQGLFSIKPLNLMKRARNQATELRSICIVATFKIINWLCWLWNSLPCINLRWRGQSFYAGCECAVRKFELECSFICSAKPWLKKMSLVRAIILRIPCKINYMSSTCDSHSFGVRDWPSQSASSYVMHHHRRPKYMGLHWTDIWFTSTSVSAPEIGLLPTFSCLKLFTIKYTVSLFRRDSWLLLDYLHSGNLSV